jgi:hypothetical protein
MIGHVGVVPARSEPVHIHIINAIDVIDSIDVVDHPGPLNIGRGIEPIHGASRGATVDVAEPTPRAGRNRSWRAE